MRAPNVTFLARARGPAHPSAAALAPGVLAAALVVALAGFAATGLWRAVERFDLSVITAPYVLHALRFTFAQAALSTLVSVVLGALLALALARRRFPLRGLVLRALGVSFVLPAIAAVFGIVALHGRSGFVSVALQSLGFAPASYLYGLPGIVLAHVFFNIPFAARGFLGALEAVPAAHWRLAESLTFRPRDVFARIDWPVLRRELPGLAGLIFILCATSFAIVLALGGGPQSATLEVAIFEALRFDFDINRAAVLSLVQIGQYDEARATLARVIDEATEHPFFISTAALIATLEGSSAEALEAAAAVEGAAGHSYLDGVVAFLAAGSAAASVGDEDTAEVWLGRSVDQAETTQCDGP